MATRAEWQKPLDNVIAELETLPLAGDGLRATRLEGAFAKMAGWSAEQKVFAFNQLDAPVIIEAVRAGHAHWWEALASATYFGNIDALLTFRASMEENPGKGTKPDFSTTMTWGAWNYSIADDVPPAMDPGVVNQLFDWGADPLYRDHSGGSYFDKALRGSPSGVIHAFLSHGAPLPAAAQVRDEFVTMGNYKQAQEIQASLGLGGFFTKADNQTVMETKYISEPGRNCVLRTVFNFGAGRINEIFELPGMAPAITSCNFDDYSRDALAIARAALEKLGGTPDNTIRLADKPKRPGLGR